MPLAHRSFRSARSSAACFRRFLCGFLEGVHAVLFRGLAHIRLLHRSVGEIDRRVQKPADAQVILTDSESPYRPGLERPAGDYRMVVGRAVYEDFRANCRNCASRWDGKTAPVDVLDSPGVGRPVSALQDTETLSDKDRIRSAPSDQRH